MAALSRALPLLVCALVAAGLRAGVLFQTDLAYGYDGWYYVIQTESWAVGQPVFADRSLLFLLTAPLSLLSGAILGNKLVACGAAALMASGGALAGRRWLDPRAGWVVGLCLAASPLLLGMSVEYLKNALGLALLPWVLALWAGARWERVLAGVLLLLGLFVHKLSGVMGLLMLPGLLLGGARLPRWVWGLGALAGLAALSWGVLRPEDLQRLTGTQDGIPRFPALLGERLGGPEQLELTLMHLLPPGLLAILRTSEDRLPARALALALLPLSLLCLAPGLPFGWDLTAWRLMLVGGLPLAFGVGLLSANWPLSAGVLSAITLVGGGLTAAALPERAPDYEAFAPALARIQARAQPGDRVVAHRGICGQIQAQTGIVCENFKPQDPQGGWLRVAYGVRAQELQAVDPTAEHLVGPYVLLSEAGWQAWVVGPGVDRALARHPRNPYRPRPDFVYGPPPDPESP